MLTIELVPSTVWYVNLRSELSKAEWDVIRKWCYKQAHYVCEVCGGKGPKWPVECHEIWEFDDAEKTQTLTGLIALCPACHGVKHIGLSEKRGEGVKAQQHLAQVNGWSIKQARAYIREAFEVWEERSQHEWALDISWVDANFSLTKRGR
jgi:hypothetical protein